MATRQSVHQVFSNVAGGGGTDSLWCVKALCQRIRMAPGWRPLWSIHPNNHPGPNLGKCGRTFNIKRLGQVLNLQWSQLKEKLTHHRIILLAPKTPSWGRKLHHSGPLLGAMRLRGTQKSEVSKWFKLYRIFPSSFLDDLGLIGFNARCLAKCVYLLKSPEWRKNTCMKHQDFFDSLLEPCSVARNQPFDCDTSHFPFCLIYHLKKDQLMYQETLVSTCENMMHQDHCEEAGESFQWRSHGLSSDNTSSVCFHQNPGEGDAHYLKS